MESNVAGLIGTINGLAGNLVKEVIDHLAEHPVTTVTAQSDGQTMAAISDVKTIVNSLESGMKDMKNVGGDDKEYMGGLIGELRSDMEKSIGGMMGKMSALGAGEALGVPLTAAMQQKLDAMAASGDVRSKELQAQLLVLSQSQHGLLQKQVRVQLHEHLHAHTAEGKVAVAGLVQVTAELRNRLDSQESVNMMQRMQQIETRMQFGQKEQAELMLKNNHALELAWSKHATVQSQALHGTAVTRMETVMGNANKILLTLAHDKGTAQGMMHVMDRQIDHMHRPMVSPDQGPGFPRGQRESPRAPLAPPAQLAGASAAAEGDVKVDVKVDDWRRWGPRQIVDWMKEKGCGPLAKILFPEDPNVQPPVVVLHGSQLLFLDKEMLLRFVPSDNPALVFAMQTFLQCMALLN